MVRNTTTRDRNWVALRRHGSGSFELHSLIQEVSAQYERIGRQPPKRLSHLANDHMNMLAKKDYLKRRPGQPNRFKPQPRLIELSRRARRELPDDAHPKAVGDFFNIGTGNLKTVPKRVMWHELLTVHEEAAGMRDENDRLARENAELRRAGAGLPSEGRGSQEAPVNPASSGDALEFMEVDDGNPFVVPEAPPAPVVGPSNCPQTPQRAQPSQSYPTPPSTVQPAVSEGSSGSAALAVDRVVTSGGILPQQHVSEQADIAQHPTVAPQPGAATIPAEDAAYDQIFFQAAQAVRLQAQREREEWRRRVEQAGADAADGTTLRAREAELAAARKDNELLSGERDLYQKKHFVTSVALKGSQKQVEKRDTEAVGLVGSIARSLGLSRWMP